MPKKRKRSQDDEEKEKPEVLKVLKEKFPQEYLTAGGKEPRKFKGEYLCQVFSRVKFKREASQALRTRTVTCGFKNGVKPEIIDDFQKFIDNAVYHFTRERVLGSLLGNYIFLDVLQKGMIPPCPGESFWNACLGSCCTSNAGKKWEFKNLADRFFEETGLRRIVQPKGNFTQQRRFLAIEMATATSTRNSVHTEKRRLAILKWIVSKNIPNPGIGSAVFLRHRHSLATEMLNFDDSPNKIEELRKIARKMNPSFDIQVLVDISRLESESFRRTENKVEKVIHHMYHLFHEHVGNSRQEFNEIVRNATELFPGKENSKMRSSRIKEEWVYQGVPPKDTAVLPLCSSTAVFIRIDRRSLEAWKIKSSDDAWWFDDVLQPFSRSANIKCLRNEDNVSYGSSFSKFVEALGPDGPEKCPWLIGSSFLTDGVQLKIVLTTLRSSRREFSGSSELNDAGYNKLPRADVDLGTLISRRRGVYNIKSVTPGSPDSIPDDTIIMSADPGQAKIINVSSAPSSVWKQNDPSVILSSSDFVSGEEYREEIGATEAEVYEGNRKVKNPSYGRAVDSLGEEVKRTSCFSTFLNYCRAWARNGAMILGETLRVQRKRGRFHRFSATQSMLAMIADKYMGAHTDEVTKVMLFGKASFRAQRGRASAPRKALIRNMAARGVVLMVDEYNTSKKCPGCKEDLVEDKERRVRSCTNFKIGSPGESCRLHPHIPVFEMDRDNVGSTNIGRRGFGFLIGCDWF